MEIRQCDPTCNPGQLMCCSPECEQRELDRRRGWMNAEQIARIALVDHTISNGSYLSPRGVTCMCGDHTAHSPSDRQNHKADVIVAALRRAGRLLE